MTLDFHQTAALLGDMAQRLAQEEQKQAQRLERALEVLHQQAQDIPALAQRVREASTSWLLALPLHEPPDAAIPAPPPPDDYAAIATDGSHIDADRHMPARYYLLNVGWAKLVYGRQPSADLGNKPPALRFAEDELVLRDARDFSHEEAVSGSLLGAVRTVEEMATLAHLAEASSPELPTLALLDGSLVLWGLGIGSPANVALRRILDQGVIAALNGLRRLAQERSLALAGYISRPGGSEVTNSLRLAACPMPSQSCSRHGMTHDRVDCRDCPGQDRGVRPCDAVAVGADRALFWRLLAPGQRSAVFLRQAQPRDVVLKQYERHGHHLAFFYLRLEEEVARVEIPLWLAHDPQRLGLLHALLLDQCHRGLGYPLAITEAHERAVITGAEREAFDRLLEEALARQGLTVTTSSKRLSKRVRWL